MTAQTQAPTPGSPEYNAAMTAKANAGAEGQGTGQPESAPAAGDKLILGKFKSQEDLAKAYTELEAKLGAPKDESKASPDPIAPIDTQPKSVDDVLAKAGLKQDALVSEFTKDGKLSDDSYNKLAEAGYPKAMVDAYMRGVQSDSDALVNGVHASVGGEEAFGKITEWARINADKADVLAFNKALESSDLARVTTALKVLKAGYDNANPTLLGGFKGDAVTGYRSNAEMIAAMQDKRYSRDPAYRAEVYAKIAAGTPQQ